MVASDTLFSLLALADVSLILHLHRRRERYRVVRMMSSLRVAVQREFGAAFQTQNRLSISRAQL